MGFWDRLRDGLAGGMDQTGPAASVSVDLPEVDGICRYRMVFFGRVQGVGFRYTMKLEAQALSITGWVHNHYDGSVVAEVQGENKSIRMLIYRMQESRYIRINEIKVDSIPTDKREVGFLVK